MIVDCNQYRLSFKDVENLLQDKTEKEIAEYIGMIAVATAVPIIVVCCFIGEIKGFTPTLLARIDSLKTFYSVDKVIGINPPVSICTS